MNRPIATTGSVLTGSILTALFLLSGCTLHDVETPGALVPPTAAEDSRLPQLRVTVAGHSRALHLQTFGNAANPVAFVLPGGPGADFRLLLPLRALSDRYYVVMWDPRGAGLSERVPKAELAIDTFVEEIAAVRAALAPNRPVTLIGHSFGANLALRYAARYPQVVKQLALIEPGPLSESGRTNYHDGFVSFAHGQDFFWQNELLTSSDHAAADYKAISVVPEVLRSFTCDGSVSPEPTWRFGAYQYYVLTQTRAGGGRDFGWVDSLRQFTGPTLLIAGTCGPASSAFQTTYNRPVLPTAQLATVTGADHISLFLAYQTQTLPVLRNYLSAYH